MLWEISLFIYTDFSSLSCQQANEAINQQCKIIEIPGKYFSKYWTDVANEILSLWKWTNYAILSASSATSNPGESTSFHDSNAGRGPSSGRKQAKTASDKTKTRLDFNCFKYYLANFFTLSLSDIGHFELHIYFFTRY